MQICYIKYNQTENPYSFVKKQMIKEIKKIPNIHTKTHTLYCAITIAMNNIIETQAKSTLNLDQFRSRVDAKGYQILGLLNTVGFWLAIVCAAIDIIKSIKKQDIGSIISIAIKYAVSFGILNMLPWIFDVIKELFCIEG